MDPAHRTRKMTVRVHAVQGEDVVRGLDLGGAVGNPNPWR